MMLFATLVLGATLGQDPAPTAPAFDYFCYVAAESSDEVYLVKFDGTQASVAKRIEVGTMLTEIEGPHGLCVAPDGKHWFLTMAHGKPFGILYKYATGSDEVVDQVELGLFPATMQISGATGLLYCVNFDLHGDMTPSSVSIVDPEEMVEVARVTTGPMPHGSRIAPDGLKHYSCAMMSGELFELDTRRFALSRVLHLDSGEDVTERHKMAAMKAKAAGELQGSGAHGEGGAGMPNMQGMRGAQGRMKMPMGKTKPTWVHPHPSRPLAYVCLNGAAQVAEIDLETWSIKRRFETAKGPYNIEVSPDGSRFVVSYKTAGEIGVWDLPSGKELARLPATRKVTHGVVITPDSRFAFVSAEGIGGESGVVDVIDLATGTKLSSVEIGLQAGGIAFWKAEPRK